MRKFKIGKITYSKSQPRISMTIAKISLCSILERDKLPVHLKLTLDIFVVLYKQLSCAGDKAIDADHTASTDCNY